MKTKYQLLRDEMVAQQIEARGVRDPKVLQAMRAVPREAFLPADLHKYAYDDSPLPIAANQTISQPFIVAFMIDALALEDGETVLEVGAGSGYAAAVLAQIAAEVYTTERIKVLAESAVANLDSLGYRNVHVMLADGTKGWPEHAPFDAILVSASGPKIPDSLKQQLKIGGRMIMPLDKGTGKQELVRIVRAGESLFTIEEIASVQFVPLIGAEGWQSDPEGTLKTASDIDETQTAHPNTNQY